MLVAFSRLTEPAWGVSVAVPIVQLTWPAWQAALTSIASGLTLLALGLWLAYWISRSVSEPISVLRRIAAASDHFSGPLIAARTGLPEAEEVAEVLRAESRRRVTEKAHLERTLAERTDALAQRDLLLREVHHRVKNNLQMVDGLLAIEVRQLSDNEARQALSVLRSRVHALGLVHEQLMQSADLRTFDIAPFLHELCHNIVAGSTNRSVSVNVEVSTLMVTLDFAIPVGLLVTELVTNCFKHLPTEGDGHISVILRRSTTGLALTVSDDGLCPIAPIGPVNAKEGQGMKIIRGLVEQLDGVMDMRYDNGYRTDIVLELEDTLYG